MKKKKAMQGTQLWSDGASSFITPEFLIKATRQCNLRVHSVHKSPARLAIPSPKANRQQGWRVTTALRPSCMACPPAALLNLHLALLSLHLPVGTRQFDWQFPMHGKIANGDAESITAQQTRQFHWRFALCLHPFTSKSAPCKKQLQNNLISRNCL